MFCSHHWKTQVPCLGDVAPDVPGDRTGVGGWVTGAWGGAEARTVLLKSAFRPEAAAVRNALTSPRRTKSQHPGHCVQSWLAKFILGRNVKEQGEKPKRTWFFSSTCLPRGNKYDKIIISPTTHPQRRVGRDWFSSWEGGRRKNSAQGGRAWAAGGKGPGVLTAALECGP